MDVIYLKHYRNERKQAELGAPKIKGGLERRIALALFRLQQRGEEMEAHLQMLEDRLDDIEELLIALTSNRESSDVAETLQD